MKLFLVTINRKITYLLSAKSIDVAIGLAVQYCKNQYCKPKNIEIEHIEIKKVFYDDKKEKVLEAIM